MTKKISSRRFTISVACFILSSSLLTSQLYIFCKNEAWISVILGFLFTVILVLLYGALAKRFPALTLIEINDIVFGKYLGKIVSLLYIFYFLSIAFLNADVIGNFVVGYVLPNTPKIIVNILFIFICSYVVKKGAFIITNSSTLITIISVIAIALNTFLLIKEFRFENLLPVFSLPLKHYLIGSHIVAMIPFGEIFIFYMMIPHLQQPEKFRNLLTLGLMIGASFMILIVFRDTLVLGNYTLYASLPTFEVIRLIDVVDILTRLEIIYSLIFFILMFFKISVCFYAVGESLRRLLKTNSYSFLVNILGVIIVIYSVSALPSSSEEASWLIGGAAEIYEMLFLFIMPGLTLTVAILRSLFFNSTLINSDI